MNLIVLFGGISSEHEISCISAASILRNIDREKYDVYTVGITRAGRWFLYEDANPDRIEDGAWEHGACTPAVLSPDRSTHGLLVLRPSGVEYLRADVVFPVLHGAFGEDGTVQGLLELSGIPYVGCGVAASANTMDKSLTKIVLQQAGIRQAAYYLAHRAQYTRDPEGTVAQAIAALGSWPVFVKPCSSGSSVGVTRADGPEALKAGLEEAFHWDSKVLVEEFIDGHEVEVAVLGNESPVASVAGEIAPTQSFYTFDAKYNDDSSALYIPAHIDQHAMETVRETAIRVYRALGCRGLSRVDFFCTYADNEIILNEVNTIPGFTSISMYPKLFEEDGIPYTKLIDRLVGFALEAANG